MAKSKFFFHLFQVTIIQMLKAHGFDKASNQRVLEVFTDIAIRYFNLLIRTVIKYMELRDDCKPILTDITHAFLELQVISPTQQLDKYDINPITNTGIENFEKWFNDDMNTRMREIARPNNEFLQQNKKSKLKLLDVKSKMENLTKALDEQAKQAQLQNPTMPYLPPPSVSNSRQTPIPYNIYQNSKLVNNVQMESNEIENDDESENIISDYNIPSAATDEDWIEYLIRDQITTYIVANGSNKEINNTNNKNINDSYQFKPSFFKGTVLSEYIPQDLKHLVDIDSKPTNNFIIAGPMPEKLLHACPYYKSDDEGDDYDSSSYGTSDDDEEEDRDEDEDNEGGVDNNNNNKSNIGTNSDGISNSVNNNDTTKMDVDNHANSRLAAYDYYEHHKLYEDEMEDLDLYGQGDTNSNDLNLFG